MPSYCRKYSDFQRLIPSLADAAATHQFPQSPTGRSPTPTMPAAATSTTNGPNNDYLRGQPPALAAVQGGLSIFAAVVILRFCIRRLRSWRSRSDNRNACRNSGHKSVVWQDTRGKDQYQFPSPELNQGRRHSHQHSSGIMNEKQRNLGRAGGGMRGHPVGFSSDGPPASRGPLPVDQRHQAGHDGAFRHLIARPPPAPPLTPPELSSTVFTLEGRPHIDDSLIHQPNPDYTSPSTTSSGSHPGMTATTSHARRLSYNKTIPIGIPVSRQSSASESDLFFSPSSYPPTSPLLPPVPPTSLPPSGPGEPSSQREIELRGEIVGVLDENGAGWSRHTRVYGGGVCLACAAAGREHGEGGFYGPNVLPEEMR